MKSFAWQPKFQMHEKILICLLVFIVQFFIVGFFTAFSLQRGNSLSINENTPAVGTIEFFGAIIFIVVYAAAEEIIFREILLRSQIHNGIGFALVSSSILFTLSHNTQIIGIFLDAIAWGALYVLTGSIIYPIVMHAINNTWNFLS